jgi:hypothetical protein
MGALMEHPRNTANNAQRPNLQGKIDILWKIIGRYDFYIASTNTKSSLIMAWNGVVIGTVLLKFDDILKNYHASPEGPIIAGALVVITGLCSLISSYYALKVVFPFLTSTSSNRETLVFFGSVAAMGVTRFTQKLADVSNDEMFADLADQGATLAIGLREKMNDLRNAIRAIYGGFAAIFILMILRFLVK